MKCSLLLALLPLLAAATAPWPSSWPTPSLTTTTAVFASYSGLSPEQSGSDKFVDDSVIPYHGGYGGRPYHRGGRPGYGNKEDKDCYNDDEKPSIDPMTIHVAPGEPEPTALNKQPVGPTIPLPDDVLPTPPPFANITTAPIIADKPSEPISLVTMTLTPFGPDSSKLFSTIPISIETFTLKNGVVTSAPFVFTPIDIQTTSLKDGAITSAQSVPTNPPVVVDTDLFVFNPIDIKTVSAEGAETTSELVESQTYGRTVTVTVPTVTATVTVSAAGVTSTKTLFNVEPTPINVEDPRLIKPIYTPTSSASEAPVYVSQPAVSSSFVPVNPHDGTRLMSTPSHLISSSVSVKTPIGVKPSADAVAASSVGLVDSDTTFISSVATVSSSVSAPVATTSPISNLGRLQVVPIGDIDIRDIHCDLYCDLYFSDCVLSRCGSTPLRDGLLAPCAQSCVTDTCLNATPKYLCRTQCGYEGKCGGPTPFVPWLKDQMEIVADKNQTLFDGLQYVRFRPSSSFVPTTLQTVTSTAPLPS